MKMFSWFQNPKMRFVVAFAAAMGFGHMVFRVLVENLGPVPGILGGLAATATLSLGFCLILGAVAKPKDSATDAGN